VAVVVLAAAILSQPPGGGDFDQIFYVTIAYNLDRYGVYSNNR
jgi:hypothetical protein